MLFFLQFYRNVVVGTLYFYVIDNIHTYGQPVFMLTITTEIPLSGTDSGWERDVNYHVGP